jgi:hypothetical protein
MGGEHSSPDKNADSSIKIVRLVLEFNNIDSTLASTKSLPPAANIFCTMVTIQLLSGGFVAKSVKTLRLTLSNDAGFERH